MSEASGLGPPPRSDAVSGARLALVALVFALTGASGLALEVVWQRKLSLLFGSTVEATGAVLAAFLGSLAVGGLLFGRRADRSRTPLRLYAALEVATGAGALLSLALSGAIGRLGAEAFRITGGEGAALTTLRCLLGLLLIAPTTVPMGGSLPALAAAVVKGRRRGETLGLLYGINTLGAACGSVLCAGLVYRVGLVATWRAAAATDILLGAMMWLLAPRLLPAGGEAPGTPREAGAPARRPASLAVLVFGSGAVVLALEVLWTRVLVTHLGSHVTTFALMLAVVLAGLAAGGIVGGRIADSVRDRVAAAALAAMAAAAAGAACMLALRGLPDFMANLVGILHVSSYAGVLLVQACAVGRVALVPSFLAGLVLPLALAEVSQRGGVGRGVGALMAASLAGTITGSLAAAFLLVPAIGAGRSMVLVLAIELALGLVVLVIRTRRPAALIAALAATGALLLLVQAARPLDELVLAAGIFHQPGRSILYHRDGLYGLLTVEQREEAGLTYRTVSVNGVNVAGTAPDLVAVQKLQAHVPLLLHPAPRVILHIGAGSGGTAASASLHRVVERIDIAEINPPVIATADRFFREVNRGVLSSEPRIHVIYGDGRNVVLSGRERYDLILSDSIHPHFSGNSTLYTREYYAICRDNLRPGGIVSQWLPLYGLAPESYRSIVRAFLAVFPQSSLWYPRGTVNPHTILVGARDGFHLDPAAIAARLRDPAIAADLAIVGIRSPEDFYADFVAGPEALRRLAGDAPVHSDDHPVIEYAFGASYGLHYVDWYNWTWSENLGAILAVAETADRLDPGLPALGARSELERNHQALSRLPPG